MDLLVMGPDCGTAIIKNTALAFANAVKPGKIGIVGASGTGIQEVSCLIDMLGLGVSHAIGTGGNDVTSKIGGLSMLKGIEMLDNDPKTDALVIVSKPPAPKVSEKVVNKLQKYKKPSVVLFLGDKKIYNGLGNHICFANTLEETSLKAAMLVGAGEKMLISYQEIWEKVRDAAFGLQSEQKYIRGIFAGGTFTVESALILTELLNEVSTNKSYSTPLTNPHKSTGHTCVDLGDDIFTAGRPYPMLEPSVRNQRLLVEMEDPQTAVLLFDVVPGYGVHPNPAFDLVKAVNHARERNLDSYVPLVASVCGTDLDPQKREEQVRILQEAVIHVFPSNASATPCRCQYRVTKMYHLRR